MGDDPAAVDTRYTEVPRSQLDARRSEYTRALLSEIRLIVRTIANDPLKRLSDLKLSYKFDSDSAIREVTAAEIIEKISEIDAQPRPRGWLRIRPKGIYASRWCNWVRGDP